ncbi:recombinase family protein [Phenylobacterium sp.]|uniref:recombinase family protein n=1 Tax=Phenylobacterium sp. TaxID=1871053 RepID=UPI0035B2908C
MTTAAQSRTPVAQYLRMSTEHQNYSLQYQATHNAAYAADHGLEIVATYADAGVSGISLKGRAELKRLLADVLGGAPGFAAVLVYDVSRWGRFQDPDQSAHYEFLCRAAGVRIVYTAEAFTADGGLPAAIVKQLKRAMAAESSRELSARISRAKRGLAAEGYWLSGRPGYGLRRAIVTASDGALRRLENGERKALQGQRTVLVAGPEGEVETVRRIFRLFAVGGMSRQAIAGLLNAEGVATGACGRWTAARVLGVLRNEAYVGVQVYGRYRYSLGQRARDDPARWLRTPTRFPPMVSRALFDLAARHIRRRKPWVEDHQLIEELRTVLRERGRLSAGVLLEHPAAHAPDVYRRRFGDLLTAYRLAGYEPRRQQAAAAESARRCRPTDFRRGPSPWTDEDLRDRLVALQRREGRISVDLINACPDLPSAEVCRGRFGGMAAIYALTGHLPDRQQRLASRSRAERQLDEP